MEVVKKYLEDAGYVYLGVEYELVFYRDDKGSVWGADEWNVIRNVIEGRGGVIVGSR